MNVRNLFSMIAAGVTLAFSMGVSAQALYVAPSGDVGIGTLSPGSPLEVRRSDGTAKILIDEQSGITTVRTLFLVKNNGSTKFALKDKNSGCYTGAPAQGEHRCIYAA